VIDLPELIETIHFIKSQHAGEGVNGFKLFHERSPIKIPLTLYQFGYET
jgi:hypothetical protein